jgi:hypothetical protein
MLKALLCSGPPACSTMPDNASPKQKSCSDCHHLQGFVALKDFFLLLGIFIWIFAIIGMQQFGGEAAFSCENTSLCRSNFDTLWEALYTSFQVLTSEWATRCKTGREVEVASCGSLLEGILDISNSAGQC